MSTELEKKEKRVRALLAGMARLGAMRPGTLTVQYRNPAEKKTPFHQLSYTHKGRSRSEYVRPESLAAVTGEVETTGSSSSSSRRSRICRWRRQGCATSGSDLPASVTKGRRADPSQWNGDAPAATGFRFFLLRFWPGFGMFRPVFSRRISALNGARLRTVSRY